LKDAHTMNILIQHILNNNQRNSMILKKADQYLIPKSSSRLRLNDPKKTFDKIFKKVFVVNGVSFSMMYCPLGLVNIVSDKEHESKRTVTSVSSFLLGETKVTQDLYQAVMGDNPSEFKSDDKQTIGKRPLENALLKDMFSFCNKLSVLFGLKPKYNLTTNQTISSVNPLKKVERVVLTFNQNANGFRLPIEYEWQFAAMAGTNNMYAGCSDDSKVQDVAWFSLNSKGTTHQVKGKLPNEWGFYDMIGNVREVCEDEYKIRSHTRKVKGASWRTQDIKELTINTLSFEFMTQHDSTIGFRILLPKSK